MKKFLTPAAVTIRAFGGVTGLAKALGKSPSSISRWQRKGFVPSKEMARILDIARKSGIDLWATDLIYGRERLDG